MRFPVKFSSNDQRLAIKFGNFQSITVYPDAKPYTGDYQVVPSPDEKRLETANKIMLDDVTVRSIPYFDVGNNTGGSTVYIGTEIEIE